MKIRLKSPLWRRIVRTLGRLFFRWAENNDDECIARNGERWFLRQLLAAHVSGGGSRPYVVFDVGANIGDYSRLVIEEARQLGCRVEIHAFEPSPLAAEKLRGLFARETSVRVVVAALSDWTGEAALHAGDSGSGHASLVQRGKPGSAVGGEVKVKVQRLDDYMAQNGVGRIDFLKLDVEGSELAVLRSLGARLSPQFVDTIQLEYGGTTRDAHVTLRDLEDYVVTRDYAFAKLFPSALEVRVYREWMDNYAYANYVAVAPRWVPGQGGVSAVS